MSDAQELSKRHDHNKLCVALRSHPKNVLLGKLVSSLEPHFLLAEFEWPCHPTLSQLGLVDAVFVRRDGSGALVVEVKALHEVRAAS